MSFWSTWCPSAVAAATTVATLVVGIVFGTYVAGGSDSSCYLNTAQLLAGGHVGLEQPLVRVAPWPNAALSFLPAGFAPSSVDPALLVPICPPGLPLTMAAFGLARVSEWLVVPLCGALAVWLTFVLGRRLDRPMTGAAAAALVACSPTFLYQVVQPMSDVPAMAWWLLVMVCAVERDEGLRRPGLAGLAASMALLTRPNLVPIAGVVAIYLAVTGSPGHRVSSAGWFVAGLLPGVALLAALQRAMYGSPWSSGYGSASELMTVAHVMPNLRRYAGWMVETHTPFLLLSLAAPALVPRPRLAWLCLAVAATTVACYLPYLVFEDWSYTRFLLPAIAPLVILSVASLVAVLERFAWRASVALAAASVVVMMAAWVGTARTRHVFELAQWERHYAQAGAAVAGVLPGDAAIVTVKNSGSVQYQSGRPTVSWDTLDPKSLDGTLGFLRAHALTPYLLLEIDEEAAFRRRFHGASMLGGLDWPPRWQVGRAIRIYDPLDRARFVADGKTRTVFLPDGLRRSRAQR